MINSNKKVKAIEKVRKGEPITRNVKRCCTGRGNDIKCFEEKVFGKMPAPKTAREVYGDGPYQAQPTEQKYQQTEQEEKTYEKTGLEKKIATLNITLGRYFVNKLGGESIIIKEGELEGQFGENAKINEYDTQVIYAGYEIRVRLFTGVKKYRGALYFSINLTNPSLTDGVKEAIEKNVSKDEGNLKDRTVSMSTKESLVEIIFRVAKFPKGEQEIHALSESAYSMWRRIIRTIDGSLKN